MRKGYRSDPDILVIISIMPTSDVAIAIVGAGASGAFFADAIRNATGPHATIDVYESTGRVGGRALDGDGVELGASMIIQQNRIFAEASDVAWPHSGDAPGGMAEWTQAQSSCDRGQRPPIRVRREPYARPADALEAAEGLRLGQPLFAATARR